MDLCRADIQLTSPTGTPWHADTLFGHLCWQIAFHEGEDAVGAFIDACRRGEPPFVVSDGFPAGLLPRPLVPPKRTAVADTLEDYAAAKKRRKAAWLTIDQFKRVQLGGELAEDPPAGGWEETQMLHASLDRNTNRTGGEGSAGRLFQTSAVLPRPLDSNGKAAQPDQSGPNLHVYARVAREGLERFQSLLEQLSRAGFGRDKSTGYGQFTLLGIESAAELDDVPEADGVVLLSGSVPAADDPSDGCWNLRTKHGRLGEEFALSGTLEKEQDTVTRENAFAKKPLLQLEPGSVFRLNGSARCDWYGSVVERIAPARPHVVQGCQAIALPLRWPAR